MSRQLHAAAKRPCFVRQPGNLSPDRRDTSSVRCPQKLRAPADYDCIAAFHASALRETPRLAGYAEKKYAEKKLAADALRDILRPAEMNRLEEGDRFEK